MAGHLKTLLTGIAANPLQAIHELPLLTEAEQQQLLAWNDTAADYPHDKTIADLFEQQAEKTPQAIAVLFENQSMTYRELNRKANQLAHYLRSLEVKPEVLAGLCLERSLEMLIGLLGILKAGGAYVPLDPAYPMARLAFMLEDTDVSILLTQSSLAEKLPETTASVICLDVEAEALSGWSAANPLKEAGPENLAYVIYTSGSTGNPKGVAIEHRNAVALLAWSKTVFTPEQLSNVLASTSLNFDVSVFEIFVPLSGGGKIILVENALSLSTLSHDISLVSMVPSAINELVNMKGGVPASVQVVNLGGEPLQNQLVQQIYQIDTIQQVFNLYGPSEDTTYSTFSLMKKGSSDVPSIGRPVANTQIYLLDSYLQPVPIGVIGELYTGGAGVTRGYFNRLELTDEKFIKHSFGDNRNVRLYKSGDLACYLPDGNIKYMGRMDNQVKIRGFRIELGEIETRLGQHPKVQENAVVVHEASTTGKRLVAYFIPYSGQLLENTELRNFLTERLPDYMIPSAFVPLETMPLTPSGKIDRRALAQLSVDNFQLSKEAFVAPQTPEEELLAGIWVSVLGIERAGVHDNFFELGGHSLLATQVMSRLRDTFDIELPLRELFESPTIAGLSKCLAFARRESVLPPITPVNRSEPLPLSFAQQRLWFLNRLEGPSATYNMPAALRLAGPLHRNALEQSLQTLVQRHENLRTAFPTLAGNPVIQISEQPFQLSVLSLMPLSLEEQQSEIQRLVNEDAVRPFDLETGPLFRASLLLLGADSHVFLLNMHHIISDGWSIGILIQEWSVLYKAFVQDQPSPLPPLPIQYADFAHWQRQWLQGEVLEQQVNYWKQQLTGIPALLELPADCPRPPVQRFQGTSLPFSLSPELTAQLKHLSQQAGATLFMTLLSAFAILLSRMSRQSDIVIGSPIANRTHQKTES
ncbi:MAG: amino acid adenylation domain-containing protein, partial [Gammaproteobacteria bacterium]|nr:amino acid adenylation domain-containing protein [Gammaproteobacteria bacterium]